MICGGSPTLEGTRLAISDVVTLVALQGHEAIACDMTVTIDEIRSCLRYCADLLCVRDGDGLPFCHGCKLARIPSAQIAEIREQFVETGDPMTIGLSLTSEEFESDLSLAWLIASEQLGKMPVFPDLP